MILLTKSSVPIIGQVASIMGWIMDGIYRVLDLVGIQNLGLCIIIFSIIIYALMTPLQVKQQKFSKLSSVMPVSYTHLISFNQRKICKIFS